jgi:hypothetical protein
VEKDSDIESAIADIVGIVEKTVVVYNMEYCNKEVDKGFDKSRVEEKQVDALDEYMRENYG